MYKLVIFENSKSILESTFRSIPSDRADINQKRVVFSNPVQKVTEEDKNSQTNNNPITTPIPI